MLINLLFCADKSAIGSGMSIGCHGNVVAETGTDFNRGVDAIVGCAAANDEALDLMFCQQRRKAGLPEAVAGGLSDI